MVGERLRFIHNEHPRLTMQDLERFTFPIFSQDEETRLLQELSIEVPTQYAVGLVIGRFQPLHYGHIYLMKQALAVTGSIIIGIGSANARNEDNPFPAEFRELMVRNSLQREGLDHRVVKIVHLPDYTDDAFWLEETIRKTGNVDVVIGNNDWVNGIFEKAAYKTLQVPLLHRGTYEGKKIREQLRIEGKLQDK